MDIPASILVAAPVVLGLARRARPPRLRLERFPGRPRSALALGLLSVVLGIVAVEPVRSLLGEGAEAAAFDPSLPRLFALHGLIAAFLFAWWLLAGCEPPGRFLCLPAGGLPRRVAAGIRAGLAAWTATVAVMTATAGVAYLLGGLEVDLPEPGPGAVGGRFAVAAAVETEGVAAVVEHLVSLPLAVRALLVLSAGVFEEAFFRSFLQSRCGLLVSTLLFTASHAGFGSPLLLVGIGTLSTILGLLFRARGDALPCMVAHATFDAVQLLVVLPALVAAR